MRKYSSFWRTPMILWVSRQIGYFNSWLWSKSWEKSYTPPATNKSWGKSTIDME
jgi:hypothetical protein